MMTVNWISETAGGLILPEFETHNGASAKRRAQDAQRKQDVRKMSASETDILKTREEKRREDIKPTLPTEESNQGKPDNAPTVPYEKIFNSYAVKLPTLPQLQLKDKARKDLIKSAWNRDERFQTVEFWDKYFDYVHKSTFLMTDCKAIGFDWLMKPANFKKVLEGNYHEHA
jgi:hypothetical protein